MSIEFKNVNFSYQGSNTSIVENLSLDIESQKIIGIVGPSGCGKSTVLRLIAGILKPQQGSISINSIPVEECRTKGSFGLVFQNPDLLPWRNLDQNVSLPLELHNRKIDKNIIAQILGDVGLLDWRNKYPHELSGGMQQRASLARALVAHPKILLLDEPFSQLDEQLRFELLFYVHNYAKKNKTTAFFVTHDISEAVMASDIIYILSNGSAEYATRIDISLPYPRSLDTAEDLNFHSFISKIRHILRNQKSSNG